MVLPGQAGRSFDIIRQVLVNVVNVFNKRQIICTAPCDGMVLRMHYQWTFWVLLGGFSAIWYSWFNRDIIQCSSHFNAETQVRLDYINICLSYPYVEDGGKRRYILFYRWVHWVLLVMAGLYYIPRKMSKVSENSKVKKLFEDLANIASRYDENFERAYVDRAARYIIFNNRTHNGLFYKYLICNFVALAIDIICFQFLDFVLQGRFMGYGFQTYPFNRDPKHYTDPMSQTFPPFVSCELHKEVQIVSKRTEKLGCHLTVMELYEKLFLVLWLWLIALITMTVLYIIYLFFFYATWARLLILRVAKPVNAKDTIRNTLCNVVANCKIGDVYLLYRIRQHFSHAKYYELLDRLSNPDFCKMILENVTVDHRHGPDHSKGGGQDSLRSRKPKAPGKFQHNLFGTTPGEGRFLPNSSILVE